jgi:3-deoxy-D-manno-octulosonic acid kinase
MKQMITVPQGFVLIERGPLTLVLRRDAREQLLGCGIGDPERLCTDSTGVTHAGRGAVPCIELDGPSKRALVRKYRRGGLLRRVLPDMFLDRHRAFNELTVTLRAAEAGVPVADILGAVSLRVRGPLYRHYLVSRELTGCCDLPVWFQQGGTDQDSSPVLRLLADTVRTMHDGGLKHGDLNLKNILISRAEPRRIFIIDWDKSTSAAGPLTPDERQGNVVRLCRSAEKLRMLGVPVPDGFSDTFLDLYWQRDPVRADQSRQALRLALKRRALTWRFLR